MQLKDTNAIAPVLITLTSALCTATVAAAALHVVVIVVVAAAVAT